MKKALIYVVPENVSSDEIYNPTQYDGIVLRNNDQRAELLGAKGSEILFVEYLGGGNVKIIRRTRWPASDEQIFSLISEGEGDGTGAEPNIFYGTEDQFQPGSPISLNKSNSLISLLLLFFAAAIILQR